MAATRTTFFRQGSPQRYMGAKQADTANGDESDDNDCYCSQYLVAKYNDMPIAATATAMEIIPIHKVAM